MNIELENLIKKYAEQTIKHLEESWNGKSTISNRARKKRYEYFNEIMQLDNNLDEFSKLLNHENEYVQLGSAFHLLKTNEKKAVEKLKRLTESKIGGVSFNAKMTLEEWKKGNIK